MKRIICIFIIFVLIFTACTLQNNSQGSETGNTSGSMQTSQATSAATVEKAVDYFPFNKDVYMKYRGEGNEFAEYETYVDYVKDNIMQIRNSNGGTTSAIVYKLEGGVLKKVYMQGEVYYRYDFTASSNQDETVIMEPIKTGTAWKLSDGSDRSITTVDMPVTTPAGEYRALEITTIRQNSTQKDYYVKGTGHIKTEFISGEDESFKVTSELEKLDMNVPVKQRIRFYFPEFDKDRVVYLDREIEISTNDDILLKLENELKTIPDNSGLSKVITPGARILGVKIDEEKSTVAVDFSSEFIKEMNAGTSFEGMLVKSITNTFGDYYQKEKVIITTEGKLYESGHIELKPGDYFTVDKENIVEYK